MNIRWIWTDVFGGEIEAPKGYTVRDYFDVPLDELLEGQDRAPEAVRSLLRAAYRGADCDGIGLRWSVT
jgi:hypothetical protein